MPIDSQTADERRTVRQERSRPLVELMHAWLTETLGRVPGRSTLAQAIRYALNHCSGLVLFLDDGRLELDTNTVERAIRPVALGRNYVRSRIMLSSNRRLRLNMKQTAALRGSLDCRYRT